MQKINSYKFYFVLMLAICAYGCDEALKPDGKYLEKRIIFGILKNTSDKQQILVSNSFRNNPEENNIEYLLKTEVCVWYGDSVKVFSPNIIENDSTEDRNVIFTNDNFKVLPSNNFEIWARFPDGHLIKSKTVSPKIDNCFLTNEKGSGTNRLGYLNPNEYDYHYVVWETTSNEMISTYNFEIAYEVISSHSCSSEVYTIPLIDENSIILNNSGFVEPNFIKCAKIESRIFPEVFLTIMQSIPQNSRIKVKNLIVNIYTYDEALSRYYLSTEGRKNTPYLAYDQIPYSNLDGGEGIFGSIIHKIYYISFAEEYLNTIIFSK